MRPHSSQQVQCAFCLFVSRSPSCIPTNATTLLPTSTMRFLPFSFQVTKLHTHQLDHTAANKYNALSAFFFPDHQIARPQFDHTAANKYNALLPFCFQVTKLYTHQCDHTAANKYNALFAFSFQVTKLYTHLFDHTAANMVHGPFGGIKGGIAGVWLRVRVRVRV